MAFQDRHYYREGGGSTSNPLLWVLTGSVPLFTIFGIRVRAHASLIITIGLILLFGFGYRAPLQERVVSSAVLFLIVLLHEFGHCFAARWAGGEADEILMHPLGGLALTRPPQRPLPMFITVAGGPAVNVVICVLCGALLWFISGQLPWNPFDFVPFYVNQSTFSWLNVAMYTWWIYQLSWMLLCFNLLPIFPLDGGQMLQTILWPHIGYYKSMNFACITGMIGAVLAGMWGLATGQIFLIVLAALGFMTCMNMRQQLKAAGPWAFQEDEGTYAAAYEPVTPKRKEPSKWAQRRARKAVDAERAEQQRIDAILAKVSAHGMHSLNWLEKRALRNATERQRKRDVARARRTH